VHFGLGYLYWKLLQFDNAKAAFEAELALDPNHAQALAYLGDIELKRGQADKAYPLLAKAVQLRGDLRIAYLDLGEILAGRHQYKDAVTDLRRAVQLDPAEPDAHYWLGRVYEGTSRHQDGQAEFAKVRALHQKAADDVASTMSRLAAKQATPQ
jgi:tetratricopeptide (TPR) repeat protein